MHYMFAAFLLGMKNSQVTWKFNLKNVREPLIPQPRVRNQPKINIVRCELWRLWIKKEVENMNETMISKTNWAPPFSSLSEETATHASSATEPLRMKHNQCTVALLETSKDIQRLVLIDVNSVGFA